MDRTRVVVIAAHPDDELLGAGGTLARHVLAGDEVHAIVVADGAGSRYPDELVAGLEKQARRAAEVIGFTSIQFLSLPDQRLDTVPLIELTQRLEGVLDEIEPGTVYTDMSESTITSPDAQKWVPHMVEYLNNLKATTDPAPGLARCAEMCVQLASRRYAALSGRFLLPGDDFDGLLLEPQPKPGSALIPREPERRRSS